MTASNKSIPDDLQNPLPDVSIDQLSKRMRAAVERAGWTSLMPVQARTIPYLLAGRGMMIQARTGSGKTGAFLLPMLECLDPDRHECQALVLVPTRELARQVWSEAEMICKDTGLRTVSVYGGVGYKSQLDALRKGAHIVVGTPGRILDHLMRRTLSLDGLEMLIFDEADHMLSMGFYPDMQRIHRFMPDHDINSCMFSATFPSFVMRTAREFIREPEFISLSHDHVHVTDTEHVYYIVPGMDKDRSLVRIIEIENPDSAIIFCNTKASVHYVTRVLQRFGYDADELSGDRNQQDRERILKLVRERKLKFLVATDVAARGLDIPDLSHVVQYELPEDVESYIHRAGRTGRAGAQGVAMSLVTRLERFDLDRIARRYKIDMEEQVLPSNEDVQRVVAERVTNLLEARLRDRDKLQTERSQRFLSLARALGENEDESALIAMLLDDYYQKMLHEPIAGFEEKPVRAEPASKARERGRGDSRGSRGDRGGRQRRPRRR